MAIPGVWTGFSNPTRFGKLVKEYNSKFSSWHGLSNTFTPIGLVSGAVIYTFTVIWGLGFRDNGDQIFFYSLGGLFLAYIVSYVVGNRWASRRLPRWAQETIDEMVSNFTLITPEAAIRLVDPIALIRVTIKLTPYQVQVLNGVHAMGTEEMNRQQLAYAASVMLDNLKETWSAAEKFAGLTGDNGCMDKFLVSVDSAKQVVNSYKK